MRRISNENETARAERTTRRLFAEVIEPYLDDAFSLARWITGNRTDAEDVVQEACLRALKGLEGFSSGNGRSWLLAIVRNTSLTWLAKNRSKAMIYTDDLEAAEREMAPEAADASSPEAALIAAADAARLEAALRSLPLPFREAIILREIHGATYREIAEITRVPVGTVMSRLARARAMVIRSLADVPA